MVCHVETLESVLARAPPPCLRTLISSSPAASFLACTRTWTSFLHVLVHRLHVMFDVYRPNSRKCRSPKRSSSVKSCSRSTDSVACCFQQQICGVRRRMYSRLFGAATEDRQTTAGCEAYEREEERVVLRSTDRNATRCAQSLLSSVGPPRPPCSSLHAAPSTSAEQACPPHKTVLPKRNLHSPAAFCVVPALEQACAGEQRAETSLTPHTLLCLG